jgi:hypothetical protein
MSELIMSRAFETRFIPRVNADEETIMRCHVLNFIINIDHNLLIKGNFKLRCPTIDGHLVAVDSYPTPFGSTTKIFHRGEVNGFVIDLFVVTSDKTGQALMQGRSSDEALKAQPRPPLQWGIELKDEDNLLEGVELYQYLIEGLVRTADLYNYYGE